MWRIKSAQLISSAHQTTDYSDIKVFWVENGRDFIRYIEKDEDFAAGDIAHALDINLPDELFSLVSNMKNSVGVWRQALDDDGSLRFYMD
jgi:hypothetical protein